MKDVKQKVTIGFLSTAIVVALGFSIYSSFFDDKENTDDEQTKETAKKEKKEDEDNGKIKEEDIILNPMNGEEDPRLSEDKKELSITEVKNSENEVRALYREAEIGNAVDLLNDLADSNKFIGNASILADLQSDGNIWLNIFGHEETNGLALINGFQGFKDPETLLLAVLNVDSDIRKHIITYAGSLNPVYDAWITPSIMNKTTIDIPLEIKTVYPTIMTLHQIHFSMDNNVLDAYVMEFTDGSLNFYTIEDVTGKAPYYTIEQWEKIDSNIKKGLAPMEGVLDMYNKYGIDYVGEVITEAEETVE